MCPTQPPCATHMGFCSHDDSRAHGRRIRFTEWSKAKSKVLEKTLEKNEKVPFHLTHEAVDRAHPFVMLAIGHSQKAVGILFSYAVPSICTAHLV